MGATSTAPPVLPGERERDLERITSTAEILPFRTGSTADRPAADTPEIPGRPIVGQVFDYRIHARGDFKQPEKPKREPRRFQRGSAERTTLDAMKKHRINAREAARLAGSRRK